MTLKGGGWWRPLAGHTGHPEASVKLGCCVAFLAKVRAGACCVISGFGGTWAPRPGLSVLRRHHKPNALLCRLQTRPLGGTDVGSIQWATWPGKSRARKQHLPSGAGNLHGGGALHEVPGVCQCCSQGGARNVRPLAPGSAVRSRVIGRVRQAGAGV